LINGDFNINQRSFSSSTSTGYTADRFFVQPASGQTVACSRQSFTPGAAPVAGYENPFFYRFALSGTPSGAYWLNQKIEDVRTFAGQPVTLSFWAKASSATSALEVVINQNFGSGGSSEVTALPNTNYSLTTSWQRFTFTATFPSISGKTVGTNSFLDVRFAFGTSTINAINVDYWGVQLEYGSKATPFQTASGGSPQAELAMCQRYYFRYTPNVTGYKPYPSSGTGISTTRALIQVTHPVTMRTVPTSVDFSNIHITDGTSGVTATSVLISNAINGVTTLESVAASGLTQYRFYSLATDNSTSSLLGLSAEL